MLRRIFEIKIGSRVFIVHLKLEIGLQEKKKIFFLILESTTETETSRILSCHALT